MNLNRPTRTLTIHSLEALDERIVPSSFGASAAAQEAAVVAKTPVAFDVHFSGVTSKTLASFEKELTNDKMKLGSISLKTDIAVGVASKAELASIAKLKHVTKVTVVTNPAPATPVTAASVTLSTSTPTSTATTTTTPALSTSTPTVTPTAVVQAATSSTPSTTLIATKGGQALAAIYQAYETYVQGGSTGTFSPPQANRYFISGTSIKLDISVPAGNMSSMIGVLEQLGMTVDATVVPGQVAIIEGFVPIAQLPTIAANGEVISMPPALRPSLL